MLTYATFKLPTLSHQFFLILQHFNQQSPFSVGTCPLVYLHSCKFAFERSTLFASRQQKRRKQRLRSEFHPVPIINKYHGIGTNPGNGEFFFVFFVLEFFFAVGVFGLAGGWVLGDLAAGGAAFQGAILGQGRRLGPLRAILDAGDGLFALKRFRRGIQ